MNALELVPASMRDSKPVKRIAAQLDNAKEANRELRADAKYQRSVMGRAVDFGEGSIAAYIGGCMDAGREPMKLGKLEISPSVGAGSISLVVALLTGSDHAYNIAEGFLFPAFYNKGLAAGVK